MPPNPLDSIKRLAAQVRRVNPHELSPGQISDWRNYSRMVFTPNAKAAMQKSQELADAAQKADTEEMRVALQAASDKALYESKRWAMMDQSSSTIARAKKNYDEDVRALWIPGADNMPAGISTFQLPGHYRDDPLAYDATHLENLGASGVVPGVGRVLLRQTGLESPSNPMIWESLNQKPTLDFYKARGAQVLHDAPEDSQFSSENTALPVFWVDRGDMIKEAKGGSIKAKGADAVRAQAHNAADAGVQTSGYDDEILAESRRRRNRDTLMDLMEARSRHAAAQPRRQLVPYGQSMPDAEEGEYLNLPSNAERAARAEMRAQQEGIQGVADSPLAAIFRNAPGVARDLALHATSFVNPVDLWDFAVQPWGEDHAPSRGSSARLMQTAREAQARRSTLREQGEQAAVQAATDTGFGIATLPMALSGLHSLGKGAVNMTTRGMRNMHDRMRTVPADVDLGNLRDVMAAEVPEMRMALSGSQPMLSAPRRMPDSSRWTDLMKEISGTIDEVNAPNQVPSRPATGLSEDILGGMRPELRRINGIIDQVNEPGRMAAPQYLNMSPHGRFMAETPVEFRRGGLAMHRECSCK